jgi:SAM-dependent methyltransferase
MFNFQDEFYDASADYRRGSPHLLHRRLNEALLEVLQRELARLKAMGLPLTVLEVGAGHGDFTAAVLAAGCNVTAIEMSRASLDLLCKRFETNDAFRGVLSPDGSIQDTDTNYSMLLCASVLHHIPDYLPFLETAVSRIVPGGTLLCLQDPLFYERVPTRTRGFERVAYGAWRVRQGNLRQAFATWRRRRRGVLDEQILADMVEYHVVRNGVDEEAVERQLSMNFKCTEVVRYWSAHLSLGQIVGERLGLENTFAVIARDHILAPDAIT